MAGTAAVDDAPINKVFFTELNLDIQRTAVDLQAGARSPRATTRPSTGEWQEGWLWACGFTISAGSNEVMHVIAERGLGLPKG
jgi:hypothetical protein